MEKKPNLRTNQVPVKVQSSDPRKLNQDPSGKQQTRNPRRRDFPSNSAQSQKNDRSNHCNSNYQYKQQQQSHNFSPKPRGNDNRQQRSTGRPNGSASDGYSGAAASHGARLTTRPYDDDGTDSIDNDFEIEMNSVYLPGSKKQNLNHLLNFNYAPRDRNDPMKYQRTGNNGKGLRYAKHAKYNKEQYLQANCQFVVKSNADYAPYAVSPDLLVEWSQIEQINFFGSTEDPQCPICLYHPVAAKMTRCGHVYCWPCILHYLALSDKKSWRKCPICYEAVHIGDLRSAVSKPHRNYICDERVTFQLMCRDKNSLQVRRANASIDDATDGIFPRMLDDRDKIMHSKLVLAGPLEIMAIIERERTELECQLVTDGIDCADSIFVEQAMDLLADREKAISGQMQMDADKCHASRAAVKCGDDLPLDKLQLNAEAQEFVPVNGQDDCDSVGLAESLDTDISDHLLIDADSNLTISDINITATNNAANANRFYFYQASDGQHLYLHSINVRMLQTMYGSLERAPQSIDGRIVQKESCSMTEELRKRLKYLQHLPVTCQFDVVEIEFEQSNIISGEIAVKFRDEVHQRQKMRQKRARDESKREKHINLENERRIGKIIHTNLGIDVMSDQHFPTCGSFDESAFPMPIPSAEPPTSTGIAVPSTSSAGPSFAKMLTSPKSTNAVNWPSLGGQRKDGAIFLANDFQPLGASHRPRTVSGEWAVGRKPINEQSEDDNSVDIHVDDIEALCAPPEYSRSFGSAIAEALNSAAQVKNPRKPQQSTQAAAAHTGAGGGNKKKKAQKMVLFSTGGHTFDGK